MFGVLIQKEIIMRGSDVSWFRNAWDGIISRYRCLNDGRHVVKWIGWVGIILATVYSALTFVLSFAVELGAVLLPFVVISLVLFWGLSYSAKISINATASVAHEHQALSWTISLLVVIVYLPLIWYGMLSTPDMVKQWDQVVGRIHVDDWHPVMHTCFIWIAALVGKTITGVAIVQLCVFALLLGRLYVVFEKYNYSRGMSVAVIAVAAFNPLSMSLFRLLLKDSAFALAGLAVTIGLIHVFETRGDWLKGWRILSLAICLTMVSFLRHNGFFYTLPLVVFLPLSVSRRNIKRVFLCLVLTGVFCSTYLTARELLTRHGVIQPRPSTQGFAESVGLPMCVMAECYISNPEKVPFDVKEFLSSFGDRNFWVTSYKGDFNSVKWRSMDSGSKICMVGKRRFFGMLWRTIKANPRAARRAFLHVTSIAWAPFPDSISCWIFPIAPGHHSFLKCFNWYREMMLRSSWGMLLTAPGSYLLLVILSFCYGIIRKGVRVCVLAVPLMCYQFGTMLLLTGMDYRFFYITVLCGAAVSLPMFSTCSCHEGK
jgi:hypothetical protein